MRSLVAEFLSKQAAALALGLSPRSIDRAIKRGQVRTILIGRRRLVPRTELARLAVSAS
jgi:hypothetical protein